MMLSTGDTMLYVDDPAARRAFSAVEAAETFLYRLSDAQAELNTAIAILADRALEDARRIDAMRVAGVQLPLAGMPIVIKDNIDYVGTVTTCGSAFWARSTPATRSASAVERLREAGAIVLAKAHMHELLYGVTSDNAFFGTCRNPYDANRIPGGSSGGCAAAVAADLCVGAIGSDTGGSIRIPAALCGIGGLRPTTGRVPADGVHPLMPMCDTIGPMARSAADMRSLLSAMDLDHGGADDAATSRLRIGIDESLFANADPEVGRLVWDAVDVLNQQDVAVRKLDIPDLALMGDVFRGLIDAAAYSVNGPSFEARPDLFGHGVRQRLEAGKEVRGHEVFKRLGAVDLWRASLEPIFRDEIDILICPTTRASAPLLAHMASAYTPPDLGALTFPWSLAGFPALTLPVGQTREGLPAGMQLIAAKGRDQLILSVAEQFQARTSWHTARPAGRGTAAPHH